jgi:xylulokinase
VGYLIGIDVGTTGTKTILIEETGKVVASATEEYPLSTPKPNWAEQNPEDWWQAAVKSIKKVLTGSKVKPDDIRGIGLSGQMHGSVFIDKNYKVLRPCILWCDQRTAKECDYITSTIGKERLIELVSNPALTGFTAGKIIWVRNNEPAIYEKTYKILLPKDYIRFRLTGSLATEVSDASGTLLLDINKRKWSAEILEGLNISKDLLPECFESPEISGKITGEIAKLTGLKQGTPVAGGGGDQAAQAVGSGIVKRGVISITTGTSGVVFAFSDRPEVDPKGRVHTFCHAVPGKWHIMGVVLSAGGSLRWFRDSFCAEEKKEAQEKGVDVYEILTQKASAVKPGAEGLVFLPYLTGERTPHADPDAKGVFFGLSLLHTKSHLIRSILEGVGFGLRDSLEIIKELKVPVEQLRLSGGGARSSIWRQILADIYSSEVSTINVTEGASYGAALLAGVGTGVYKNVEEACNKTIKADDTIKPDKKNSKNYDKYYDIYQSLYSDLKSRFKKVSKLL